MSFFIMVTAKAGPPSSTNLYLPGETEGAKNTQDKDSINEVLSKHGILPPKILSF